MGKLNDQLENVCEWPVKCENRECFLSHEFLVIRYHYGSFVAVNCQVLAIVDLTTSLVLNEIIMYFWQALEDSLLNFALMEKLFAQSIQIDYKLWLKV